MKFSPGFFLARRRGRGDGWMESVLHLGPVLGRVSRSGSPFWGLNGGTREDGCRGAERAS